MSGWDAYLEYIRGAGLGPDDVDDSFRCPGCGADCTGQHTNAVHDVHDPETGEVIDNEPEWRCSMCGRLFYIPAGESRPRLYPGDRPDLDDEDEEPQPPL